MEVYKSCMNAIAASAVLCLGIQMPDAAAAGAGWTPNAKEVTPVPSTGTAFDDIRRQVQVVVLLGAKCEHVAILNADVVNGVADLLPDLDTYNEHKSGFVMSVTKALEAACKKAKGMKAFKPRGDQGAPDPKRHCNPRSASPGDPTVTSVCRITCQDIASVEWLVPLATDAQNDLKPLMLARGEAARAELRRQFGANSLPVDLSTGISVRPGACNISCVPGKTVVTTTIAGRTYCYCK
jgi:hypothetical protein